MKAELIHLLHKLKAEIPAFHSILIFPNGACQVVTSVGSSTQFKTLDHLEAYAWPQTEEEPRTAGLSQITQPITPA